METESEVSFVWLPVGLVPTPDPDPVSTPAPVPDDVVCCVECVDKVLKILLLSSLANCDAPPPPPPPLVLALVLVVGLESFFVDTNMILENVSFTGLAMHDIMFIISSYADIDFDATPTTLSPRELVVVYCR